MTASNEPGGEPVAFLFSAQGTQWAGMGRALFESEPEFRDVLLRCDNAIHGRLGWRLRDELFAPAPRYRLHQDARYTQPALSALQLALVRALADHGIECCAAGGLSAGEIVAAYCTGAIDLDEAMAIACAVALLSVEELKPGIMALVDASWDESAVLVEGHLGHVTRAVEFSPTRTVISGEQDAVAAILSEADRRGMRGRLLPLTQPFHSFAVDSLGARFIDRLRRFAPARNERALYSSVTGDLIDGVACDARHWWRMCSDPNRFLSATRAMIRDGYREFIEIGPDTMLAGTVYDCARERGTTIRVQPLMAAGCGVETFQRTVQALLDRGPGS